MSRTYKHIENGWSIRHMEPMELIPRHPLPNKQKNHHWKMSNKTFDVYALINTVLNDRYVGLSSDISTRIRCHSVDKEFEHVVLYPIGEPYFNAIRVEGYLMDYEYGELPVTLTEEDLQLAYEAPLSPLATHTWVLWSKRSRRKSTRFNRFSGLRYRVEKELQAKLGYRLHSKGATYEYLSNNFLDKNRTTMIY